jgi:excisionase family DNA binding protein
MIDVGNEALDMLDIGEVATRLRLSKTTIRRLIRSGELEGVKVGTRVLVAPEAVAEYKDKLRAAARARQVEQHGDRPAA